LHWAHLALSSRRLAGTRFRAEHDAQATSMPARCGRLRLSQGVSVVPWMIAELVAVGAGAGAGRRCVGPRYRAATRTVRAPVPSWPPAFESS
jgi:hypothetical protein